MENQPYPPNGSRTPESRARREAYWRQVLARWKASRISKVDFARREAISRRVLSWWGSELRRRDQARRRPAAPTTRRGTPTFLPVRVAETSTPATPIEVVAGGSVVRVRPGFDAETLRRIVATLEGRVC